MVGGVNAELVYLTMFVEGLRLFGCHNVYVEYLQIGTNIKHMWLRVVFGTNICFFKLIFMNENFPVLWCVEFKYHYITMGESFCTRTRI